MDSWTSENNPVKQTLLSVGCSVVGLALIAGFRDFSMQDTNSLAGFLLGLLLLGIGVSAFLAMGKQTIVIDPKTRRIVVEERKRFRTKKRLISFSDVVETHIGYLGKRSNLVNFYYIILKLRSGEAYPLFSPGYFFEGGADRSVMEDRRRRLEEYLRWQAPA